MNYSNLLRVNIIAFASFICFTGCQKNLTNESLNSNSKATIGSMTIPKAVPLSSTGIGGYNFGNTNDQAFAFDYEHSGKQDYLVCYRPGAKPF